MIYYRHSISRTQLLWLLWIAALACTSCKPPVSTAGSAATGYKLFEEGKLAEAIPHLEMALVGTSNAREKSVLQNTIGHCYVHAGDFEKGFDYLDRAIAADPQNPTPYVHKGIAYRMQEKYAESRASYEQALKLAPNHALSYAYLGALDMRENNPEAAIKHLLRAVELNDSIDSFHADLAVAYATAGRFDDAEEAKKKAAARGYSRMADLEAHIEQLRNATEEDKK